jgi:hypothetical protein
MSIFKRFRRWNGSESPEQFAIPLSPAEVQILVAGLQEDDRLTRVHRPDISGGSGFARSEADAMLRRAGAAAARGETMVPLLVSQLSMYEYVMMGLHRYAPKGEITAQFQAFLTRCQFMAGVAKVQGWTVTFDTTGPRWGTLPTQEIVAKVLEITDGTS